MDAGQRKRVREEDEEKEEEEKRKKKRTKRSLCLRANLGGPGRFSHAGKGGEMDGVG